MVDRFFRRRVRLKGRRCVSYVAVDRCEGAIRVGPSLALGRRCAAFPFKRKVFFEATCLLWTKA